MDKVKLDNTNGKKKLVITGRHVNVRVTSYGVTVNGKALEEMIRQEFGVTSYENSQEFTGNVFVVIEKFEPKIEVIKNQISLKSDNSTIS